MFRSVSVLVFLYSVQTSLISRLPDFTATFDIVPPDPWVRSFWPSCAEAHDREQTTNRIHERISISSIQAGRQNESGRRQLLHMTLSVCPQRTSALSFIGHSIQFPYAIPQFFSFLR